MASDVLKKVLRLIRENALFVPGDTLLVAVSGGADSVALLDILASLPDFRLNLVAAHLNHLLRGAAADADEEFVRSLAQGRGIPVLVKRVDVRELARREKRSLEDAGRCARYAFFDEAAAACGARAVALGHHADDQAETVLLRLLRGAAGPGLCAMAPGSRDIYVRPLLGITRGEIEEYLRERGLAWRHDESNDSPDFLRNRVRNELIPLLSTYNPAISARLAATADALAADEEFLETAANTAFASHAMCGADMVVLAAPGLQCEPRAIRLRLYRRAIAQLKGDLARIGYRHLQALDALLFSPRPHLALRLPDGVGVAKSYDEVRIAFREEKSSHPYEFPIDGPGTYPIPGGTLLTVEFAPLPADAKALPATTACFDAETAPFPWRGRNFRPGDRISPFGMIGQKKVKELYIDAKVPLAVRRSTPLLFCGERLLWVAGIRRSAEAPITERTMTCVRVELHGRSA